MILIPLIKPRTNCNFFLHKPRIENLLDYHMLVVQLSLFFVEFLGIWLLLLLGMVFLLCLVIPFLEEGQDDVNSRQDVFFCIPIPPITFSYTLLFCFPF
jgi:hypothetical protein